MAKESKRLTEAKKEMQNFEDKCFADQRIIMEYFVGKTVKSIETVDADIIDGAWIRTPGKQTTVTFTDGSGFTFDQVTLPAQNVSLAG
jgi:hypothetical protein